jgi:hypothetical protein
MLKITIDPLGFKTRVHGRECFASEVSSSKLSRCHLDWSRTLTACIEDVVRDIPEDQQSSCDLHGAPALNILIPCSPILLWRILSLLRSPSHLIYRTLSLLPNLSSLYFSSVVHLEVKVEEGFEEGSILCNPDSLLAHQACFEICIVSCFWQLEEMAYHR